MNTSIWEQKNRLDENENSITEEEWNHIAQEQQNILLGLGYSLNDLSVSNNSRTKYLSAINQAVLQRQLFNASGTNNYTLTATTYNSLSVAPFDFTKPLLCSFIVTSNNTGNCTITIDGASMTSKPLVDMTGSQISSGVLVAGSFVSVVWNPGLDKWQLVYNTEDFIKINDKLSLANQSNRKFAVNNGKKTQTDADFIQKDSNSQITILAGGSNPSLEMTYANGDQKIETANQVINNIKQNGTYTVYNAEDGYKLLPTSLDLIGNIINGANKIYSPKNTTTQGTANRTNANAVLSNVLNVDWQEVKIGSYVGGTGIATSFTGTATTTNGSSQLTAVAFSVENWAKLEVGKKISGTGIPANSYITAFDKDTGTITISANATANGTAIAITITHNVKITAFDSTAKTITMDTNAISTATAGAITIYENADLTVFKAGMSIAGTGIATNATISSIDSVNKTITISANATANTDLLNITSTQIGFHEGIIEPASPLSGDLYVNTNPLYTKKYNGTEWVDYDFVLLGAITKASGVIATPESCSFNAQTISPLITIPVNGTTSTEYRDMLYSDYVRQYFTIVNITGEWGFSEGEQAIPSCYDGNAADAQPQSRKNKNTASFSTGPNGFYIQAKSLAGTRGIDRLKWKARWINERSY